MAKITSDFRQAALRRGIVVRSSKAKNLNAAVSAAAVVEMANLGFVVALDDLSTMDVKQLTAMIDDARVVMGADREWTAIYPGFPKQVEELSTLTLLVEQLMHYWSAGTLLPNYPQVAREGLPLEDMLRNAREVRVLSAAATAREMIVKLATSGVALSEDERTLMAGAMELQHPDLALVASVARDARHGENLQTFVAQAFAVGAFTVDELVQTVAPYCDNLDQLLRLVLAVATKPAAEKWASNYELAISTLADRHARAVRMDRLSRPSRHTVVNTVGKLSRDFKADRLVGRQDLWRTVMRAVHPYDFKLSEAEKRAVDIVHTNLEYRTLNSLVEEAMEKGKVKKAVKLMAEHQPSELLRRAVALLRLVKKDEHATVLAKALREQGQRAAITTLISAYNGIIAANDDHGRVNRVAGMNNTMLDRSDVVKVDDGHVLEVAEGVLAALRAALARTAAPVGAVNVVSTQAVPLVRRDAATGDRQLDRGAEMTVAGAGDILRIFGHWRNNQNSAGYMDIGAVVLDKDFAQLAVSTWDTYAGARDWSTYSGDKLVYPGDSAPEYIDVKLSKLRKAYPAAAWVAMTVQSYSGWPMADVDFIAGAMLRSNGDKGDTFDARTVTTAFKPTSEATQAVPLAVELATGRLVWLDSSNGSTQSHMSASRDTTVGTIVYDEIARPRLTMGELGKLWAEAHGASTVDEKVNREELLALLS